ncbi:hypothetical protein Tco_0874932 [Tanacetum coccineum]|uniref:Uncharacterized protein n=1 Tax=Tanacetum coccineum TaxID=301880 RepID=A0ABQ5BND5_9ASTR
MSIVVSHLGLCHTCLGPDYYPTVLSAQLLPLWLRVRCVSGENTKTTTVVIARVRPKQKKRKRKSGHRMIAETDPTQREEALTETGQNLVLVPETTLTVCTTRLRGQLHTILEDMDYYLNACLEELEAFMTLWDVNPRVEESSLETLSMDELINQIRQMCEDAEDRASNA